MADSMTRQKAAILAILRWLRSHGYHIVFGLTLILLTALVTWWSVFIRQAIELQREYHYNSALDNARIRAFAIGHNRDQQPIVGELAEDSNLEIIRCGDDFHTQHAVLAPFWPEYCLKPSASYIAAGEEKFRRQLIMVTGESSVLMLAVIICCFMLYQVIRLERRSARQLKEFWHRLTHELKTPITGIKAFLQTLQTQEFSRVELVPLVRLALREVERQEMLAENLLVGQRIAREGLGLKNRSFNLPLRVIEFFEEHRILFPEDALSIANECSEEVTVHADPDALWVILENLTDNALKYGGNRPKIRCTISADSSHGTVLISDSGVGFDQAESEKLFEAYQRLTSETPVGRHGTGMGLYLSRQLATKMGGSLVAQSSGPGQGASFILSLKRFR